MRYLVVEHVCEYGAGDCEWTGAEESAEEARDHEGLVVLGYGYCGVEDCEGEGCDDNGWSSSVELYIKKEMMSAWILPNRLFNVSDDPASCDLPDIGANTTGPTAYPRTNSEVPSVVTSIPT